MKIFSKLSLSLCLILAIAPWIHAQDIPWDDVDKTGSDLADLATRDASDLTGTLDAARLPALSGAVSTSAGSAVTSLNNGAVSLASLGSDVTAVLGGGLDPTLYQGTWTPSTNTPTIDSADGGNSGYWYYAVAAGTASGNAAGTYALGDRIKSNGASWLKLPAPPTTIADASVSEAMLDPDAVEKLNDYQPVNRFWDPYWQTMFDPTASYLGRVRFTTSPSKCSFIADDAQNPATGKTLRIVLGAGDLAGPDMWLDEAQLSPESDYYVSALVRVDHGDTFKFLTRPGTASGSSLYGQKGTGTITGTGDVQLVSFAISASTLGGGAAPSYAKLKIYFYSVGGATIDCYALAITARPITGTDPTAFGLPRPLLSRADLPAHNLLLPDYYYAVAGREVNLYFANVTDSVRDYHIDVTCAVGKQQNERWVATPSNATTTSLTVALYDQQSAALVSSASTSLVVAASTAGGDANRKLLFIGDSTTAAGSYTSELVTLDTADANLTITLLGTQGAGSNKHEGQGGYSVGRYYAPGATYYAGNPFVVPAESPSGTFDFDYYLTDTGQSMSSGDWVFINLGINDVFGLTTDAAVQTTVDTALARLELILTNIKATVSGIKIGMVIAIPPSADQDAFGDNYDSGQTQWRYKRNWRLWASRFIEQFRVRTGSDIYLVPVHLGLDTTNNMARAASGPANSRTTEEVARQSNGVHAANSGYAQIADSIWAFLKTRI